MDDKTPSSASTLDNLINQLKKQNSSSGVNPPAPARPSAPVAPSSAPANLPTSSAPLASKPAPSPAPQPLKPTPPAPQPAPVVKPPAPAPVQPSAPARPQEIKSSLRTMAQDVGNIKSGQAPSGIVDVKKTVIPPAPAVPKPASAPIQPSAPAPLTAKPVPNLNPPRPITPPSPTAPIIPTPAPIKPASPVPPAPLSGKKSINPLFIVIVLGLLAIGGLAYWLLSSPSTPEAVLTPTPEATQVPTATPRIITAIEIFNAPIQSITLADSTDPITAFLSQVNAIDLPAGQMDRLSITTPSKGSGELDPLTLLTELGVTYPANLGQSLANDSIILAYGQRESYDSKGQPTTSASPQKRLIFVQEISNSSAWNSTAADWESSAPTSLNKLFGFNVAKAPSAIFSDGVYQGATIRYQNYPYADHSLDMAVVSLPSGKNYAVVANSREAIFAAIDKLLGSSALPH